MTVVVLPAMFAVFLLLEVPILAFGLKRLGIARRLAGDDASEVAEARTVGNEPVEVRGRAAVLENTTEGKYSGAECLAYSWKRTDTSGNGTVEDYGTEGEPFLVRDGTGEIAVDPAGAQISGEEDTYRESDTEKTEQRIEPGDEVHVYGHKQSVIQKRDGMGTESVYVGSTLAEKSTLEKIRGRPHMVFGILIGQGTDLFITAGDESDAVRSVGLLGVLFTVSSVVSFGAIISVGYILLG